MILRLWRNGIILRHLSFLEINPAKKLYDENVDNTEKMLEIINKVENQKNVQNQKDALQSKIKLKIVKSNCVKPYVSEYWVGSNSFSKKND